MSRPDEFVVTLGRRTPFFRGFADWMAPMLQASESASGTSTNTRVYIDCTGSTGAPGRASLSDFFKGMYLKIGSEERKIVSYNTASTPCYFDVSPAFSAAPQDSCSDCIKVLRMPTGSAINATSGCVWDGSDWDCSDASYFTLVNWPADNQETKFAFTVGVLAAKEITADGAAIMPGIPTTADPAALQQCNKKCVCTVARVVGPEMKKQAPKKERTLESQALVPCLRPPARRPAGSD